VLAPLRADDAEELVGLLDEPNLRAWLRADDAEELRARFEAWETRRSLDGDERWLNWVVRAPDDGRAVGWVQATVHGDQALLAWAILAAERGRGFASGAVRALPAELPGVIRFEARIEEANVASQRVAAAAGFSRTDRTVGGEAVWMLAIGSES
jgi:RimJ/RimL family protein N-acetyltransferase